MPVLQNTTADKTRLIANFNYEQAYQIQHQAIFLKCNLRLLALKKHSSFTHNNVNLLSELE